MILCKVTSSFFSLVAACVSRFSSMFVVASAGSECALFSKKVKVKGLLNQSICDLVTVLLE